MKLSLDQDRMAAYVVDELVATFPDYVTGAAGIAPRLRAAFERVEFCFFRIRDKYFADQEEVIFDHFISDKYATVLYVLSTMIWRKGNDDELATRVYYLKKQLNAINPFHQVELPDIFLLYHCMGTVLSRANYSDYLVVHRNCTIGENLKGEYPVLEQGVAVYAGSTLAGDCHIHKDSRISVGTVVWDTELPGGRVVLG